MKYPEQRLRQMDAATEEKNRIWGRLPGQDAARLYELYDPGLGAAGLWNPGASSPASFPGFPLYRLIRLVYRLGPLAFVLAAGTFVAFLTSVILGVVALAVALAILFAVALATLEVALSDISGDALALLVILALPAFAACAVSVVFGLVGLVSLLVVAVAALSQAHQDAHRPPPPPPPGSKAMFGDTISEQTDRERALERARRRWHQSQPH